MATTSATMERHKLTPRPALFDVGALAVKGKFPRSNTPLKVPRDFCCVYWPAGFLGYHRNQNLLLRQGTLSPLFYPMIRSSRMREPLTQHLIWWPIKKKKDEENKTRKGHSDTDSVTRRISSYSKTQSFFCVFVFCLVSKGTNCTVRFHLFVLLLCITRIAKGPHVEMSIFAMRTSGSYSLYCYTRASHLVASWRPVSLRLLPL